MPNSRDGEGPAAGAAAFAARCGTDTAAAPRGRGLRRDGWSRRIVPAGAREWFDPRFLIKPGEERARRFLAVLLFGQRASYLMLAIVNVFGGEAGKYSSLGVDALLLTAAVAWNLALGVLVARRGWFAAWMVAADAAVVSALLVATTANCLPQNALTSANWSPKLVLATASLAGVVMAPLPAFSAGLSPAAVYVWVLISYVPARSLPLPALAGELNSCLWFGLLLHFMRRYLLGQARAVDEATRELVDAETRRSAERARSQERIAHFRQLHDTALATLTAISRGGLDHRAEQVRRRCAADADYIRRLLLQDDTGAVTGVADRLAAVATTAADWGLRVHYLQDGLDGYIPAHVGEVVADACREALNNVIRHAGTSEAWLTATVVDQTLTVRVADRGAGFDAARVPEGFGLRRSIGERMRDIGGRVSVFSMPRHGTCVELSWRSPAEAAANAGSASVAVPDHR